MDGEVQWPMSCIPGEILAAWEYSIAISERISRKQEA